MRLYAIVLLYSLSYLSLKIKNIEGYQNSNHGAQSIIPRSFAHQSKNSDISYKSLTEFNTTFRPFPGIENILLRSKEGSKTTLFVPRSIETDSSIPSLFPFSLKPNCSSIKWKTSSRPTRMKFSSSKFETAEEDRVWWDLWKQRKELEVSLQNLLIESMQTSNLLNSPTPYRNIRSDSDQRRAEQIGSTFEVYRQFHVLEKIEIIQLISNFYRDLFNTLADSSTGSNKDPSYYWCQTNNTVFRPIGGHNIYHGYQRIANYYHKFVPLTTMKSIPLISDLYVHYYGNVAVVTNQFIDDRKDFNQENMKSSSPKQTKRLSVPYYATTILVKSQNDGRYYIHSHVVEGYSNMKRYNYDSLRTSYWEPPIRPGRRIPIGDPYAPTYKLDKDNNPLGLSALLNDKGDEDDDGDEDDEDENSWENNNRKTGSDNFNSGSENRRKMDDAKSARIFPNLSPGEILLAALQEAIFRSIQGKYDPSSAALNDDMNKMNSKLEQSQSRIAKELATMKPETRERSIAMIRRQLGEGELQRILKLVENYDTNGNLLTDDKVTLKDDDEDGEAEIFTLKPKDPIIISDSDEDDDGYYDYNSNEKEKEGMEDETLDPLTTLTTNSVLYLFEKGRLTAEAKKSLISYVIECAQDDQFSKLEVAFAIIIGGVRPEAFEKKAKSLISMLSPSLAISNNAFAQISEVDMEEFEMICHRTVDQLKELERLELALDREIELLKDQGDVENGRDENAAAEDETKKRKTTK